MNIENKTIEIKGKIIKVASISEEWYEDIDDPESFVKKLKKNKVDADIFTFWQRFPDNEPKFNYHMEWDAVAIIPIKSYEYWWQKQIKKRTRNIIRKSQKKGVVVKRVKFDDELINGIFCIYNETPIRQGKPFWHYGKDLETVRKENATYMNRSEFFGAFFKNELIGYMKLTFMECYADPMQILSKVSHRDKAPTNALIAHAVKICAEKGIPFFPYGHWSKGGLGKFKSNNGFEKAYIPRFYIPLNVRGKFALKTKLHHGFFSLLPEKLKETLLELRKKIYLLKYKKVLKKNYAGHCRSNQ